MFSTQFFYICDCKCAGRNLGNDLIDWNYFFLAVYLTRFEMLTSGVLVRHGRLCCFMDGRIVFV